MKVYNILYEENIELTLKAIFLLKIFFKLKYGYMSYSDEYDWMHRETNLPNTYYIRDEFKSMDKAYWELKENNLIENIDVSEGSYLKSKISKKGEYFKDKLDIFDTPEFDILIPENFKKELI